MPQVKALYNDPRDDAQLVEAANAGELTAFTALYNRHRRWVVDLAYRFTKDRDQATDVLLNTFAYVLGRFPSFRLQSNMRTFLYPVVRHIAISTQNKARRMTYVYDTPSILPQEDNFNEDELREQLAAIVESFPPSRQEVVFLRYVDRLSLEGIANVMKIPLGTVKSRLRNALVALRTDEITARYFEEEPV